MEKFASKAKTRYYGVRYGEMAAEITILLQDQVRYTLDGAAFLLGVPRSTVHGWANGYISKTRWGRPVPRKPILQTDRTDPTLINFYELIELLYVKELTRPTTDKDGNPVPALMQVSDVEVMSANLVSRLGAYPLASAELRRVCGQIVTEKIEPDLFTNPALMQHLLAYADELVVDLEFRNNIVSVWYPVKDHSIRVDPARRFGLPMVNSGHTAEAIYNRYLIEGKSPEDTAEWFEIDPAEVSQAVAFMEAWQSKPAA